MSEDEGTPMEGPLPLELQQIRADTQREEAALAAAKAALAAQRRKSEVSEDNHKWHEALRTYVWIFR